MCKNARLLQRPRFMYQRDQSLRTHAHKLFFLKHARYKFARFAMSVFHCINQRQCDFPFLQIAQHWFAKLLCRRRKIQQVIHKLKRQTRVRSVIRKRFFLFSFESTEHCAESRASAKKACCFVRRKFQGIFFSHINTANLRELNQFAFDHLLGEINQDIENAEIALFERHLKRLHVQPIAGKHAAVISPARIRRRATAPRVRAVNHIIMNQRCTVQQFHHSSETNRSFSATPCVAVRKQQQCRPHPLSTSAQQVTRNFRHRLKRRGALSRELLLNKQQIFANKLENLFCRQKGDLFSPGFRCHLSGTPRPWALAAGQDRRSAENSRRSWRPLLRCSSFSQWPAFSPLPQHTQVHFSYHDTALERGTGNPFQSKCFRAAKLSQCRANSALSEKLNFPQKKSGSRYQRRVLRLPACWKNSAECRQARSAPILLPVF